MRPVGDTSRLGAYTSQPRWPIDHEVDASTGWVGSGRVFTDRNASIAISRDEILVFFAPHGHHDATVIVKIWQSGSVPHAAPNLTSIGPYLGISGQKQQKFRSLGLSVDELVGLDQRNWTRGCVSHICNRRCKMSFIIDNNYLLLFFLTLGRYDPEEI